MTEAFQIFTHPAQMSDSELTLQNEFDAILFKEGSFSSLTWLLQKGYLEYDDYEKWRKGETGFLEDHFKTERAEILANLKLAGQYAKRLKLESLVEPYTGTTLEPIKISRSNAEERIFCSVYQPRQGRMQTDLFFDGAPALAVHDLINAFADRRHDEIPALLARLKSVAPEKYPEFERLREQQKQIAGLPDSGSKLEFLQGTLSPSAFQVLGRSANDFLIPYWRELMVELSGRPYDAKHPDEHSSFAAFHALRWSEVIESIENEAGWNSQPVFVFRIAEALFKTNREAEGFGNWFRLFLQFPDYAVQTIEKTCNDLLLSDWRGFNDLDPELEANFFPAWLLVKKSPLARISPAIPGPGPAHCAFQLIRELSNRPTETIDDQTLNLRAGLKQQSPDLFVHYMAKN